VKAATTCAKRKAQRADAEGEARGRAKGVGGWGRLGASRRRRAYDQFRKGSNKKSTC